MATFEGASGRRGKKSGVVALAAIALVAGHFAFVMAFFEGAISTPDASSYFTQARLIAQGCRTYVEPESPLQYVGIHWNHTGDNRYYCTHAPGLGVILAPIYKVLGPKATVAVNPALASLSLLGLFLLCRMWVGEGWGLIAVALMAVNPFANEHAHFGDAHAAESFLLVWGLLFVAKWVQSQSAGLAFGAGLLLGFLPTVRYPSVLYVVAAAVFVLLYARKSRRFWCGVAAGTAGAAIPLTWLCVRNQMAFGAFWRTGYSSALHVEKLFGLEYLAEYALPHLKMLLADGAGLTFAFGAVGIAMLCARRDTWRLGALFAMLVIPVTLLYMSYFWGPDGQSMRYLIPTFFIYSIATVWVFKELLQIHRASAVVGCAALVAVTVLWGLPQSAMKMAGLKSRNGALARVADAVEENVEVGSVLVAGEGISQHLDFVGRWKLADAGMLGFSRPGESGPADGPRPRQMPFGELRGQVMRRSRSRNVQAVERYGALEDDERFSVLSQDISRWAGEKGKVYLLAKEAQVRRFERELPTGDELVTVGRVELPVDRRFENPGGSGSGRGARPSGPMRQAPRAPGGDEQRGGPGGMPVGLLEPNRIFDLAIDGEPLLIVEWKRGLQR
jgi:hypothetical protein